MIASNAKKINGEAASAAAFLSALYGDDAPGWITLLGVPSRRVCWYPAADVQAAAADAIKFAATENVYYGVGLRRERLSQGRGRAPDVAVIPGLWWDLDLATGAHARAALPHSQAEAVEFLRELPLPPTAIVHSGGGLHGYWVFREPWVLDTEGEHRRAAGLSASWQATLRALALKRGWAIENTSDLARVLRLPGTTNRKETTPKPVRLIEDGGPRYNPDDFEPVLVEPVDEPPKAAPPIEGKVKHPHRDNTLMSLAGSMRRRGMGKEAILAALRVENDRICDPPKPDEDLERIAHNVAQYAPADAGRNHPGLANGKPPADEEGHAPDPEPWPDPPGKVAYHGLAGDIVEALAPYTESHPVAILAQFLTAFGNAIGRGPYSFVGSTKHHTNNNVLLIGPTSKGRKGTAWDAAYALLASEAPDWAKQCVVQTGGLSSGEGLISQVRDPIEGTKQVKEDGKQVTKSVIVDLGVEDKRLLVVEPEFASVLRRMSQDSNTLSAVLRGAWDKGLLRTLVKNSPLRATGAHVSVIGHITADELERYLDKTEAANGFANRFLFLCVRRVRCLPDPQPVPDEVSAPLKRELQAALTVARTVTRMTRDAAATELWYRAYPDLSADRPGMLGAVTARAEAHVLRWSMIYALLDGEDQVRVPHLEAALELWRYAEASAAHVFGSSVGDPIADEILAALRRAGDRGMTRTEIRDLFDRNQSAGRINRALGLLARHGLVRSEEVPTGRRPRTNYYASSATT